jgi:hypothetical protein
VGGFGRRLPGAQAPVAILINNPDEDCGTVIRGDIAIAQDGELPIIAGDPAGGLKGG